ncbi:molecular chaperone [Erwinia endophytica]|nr:molecular chaperone [Erwinia endophytica]
MNVTKTSIFWCKAITTSLVLGLLLAQGASPALAGQKPAGPVRYPGFGLGASRVVVMADDASTGQVIAMNNSDSVYLVQTRIWPADGLTGYPLTRDGEKKTAVPFLVTPPLKRLDSWSTMQLRILVTPANNLPADRESLFFLASKAIPSEAPVTPAQSADGAAGSATMSMALQSFIKFYYRPKGLKPHAIFDGDVAPRIRVSRTADNHLHITNPTPYYLTFGVLTVDGKAVGPEARRAMVPPMGGYDYPMPAGAPARGGIVKWQLIDEFGLVTDEQHQPLS